MISVTFYSILAEFSRSTFYNSFFRDNNKFYFTQSYLFTNVTKLRHIQTTILYEYPPAFASPAVPINHGAIKYIIETCSLSQSKPNGKSIHLIFNRIYKFH